VCYPVSLAGAESVEKGQAYTLEVQVQDPNPESSGVTLTTLLLDWGDGNQETIPLSGRQVSLQRSHTYTAAGSFTITAQVREQRRPGGPGLQGPPGPGGGDPHRHHASPGPHPGGPGGDRSPSETTALTAEITPETPLVPQSLRPLDLKNQYRLALYRHNGAWRGALSLPSGLVYRLVLVANTPSGEVRSQEETFRATGAEMSLQKTFVAQTALPSCPLPQATLVATYQIQGSGDTSPLQGQTVAVRGVVTAVFPGLRGFYIQDPTGDGDPNTSDGLFVYYGNVSVSVIPGQYVQATGPVAEYAATGDTLGTLTQVSPERSHQPNRLRHGRAARGGGRHPAGDQPGAPGGHAGPRGEPHRSGCLQPGPFWGGGPGLIPPHPPQRRCGIPSSRLPASNLNLANYGGYTLVLDDASTQQNPNPIPYLPQEGTLRVGDRLLQAEGVLEWRFGAYRLQPTSTPSFATENPRPEPPASTA
jgi:hypothetical protein